MDHGSLLSLVLVAVRPSALPPAAFFYYLPNAGIRRYVFAKAPLSRGLKQAADVRVRPCDAALRRMDYGV